MITIPTIWIFILLAAASGGLVAAGVGLLWLVSRSFKKKKITSDVKPEQPTSP